MANSLDSRSVSDDFNSLDIQGMYASHWEFVAQEKLVLSLKEDDVIPPTSIPRSLRAYELQFNRILGGSIQVESSLGKIASYQAKNDTDLLNRLLKNLDHIRYGETFFHFEMTFDQGRLDVIARDYFFTVTGWFLRH